MKNSLIKSVVFGSIIFLASAGFAQAEEYDDLVNTLTDLSGWDAEEAKGMSINAGGMSMTQAMRRYGQGEKEVTAIFMIGGYAQTMGTMQDIQMETSEMRMKSEEINGFRVYSTFNKTDQAGAVVVGLVGGQQQGAILTLSYEGISDSDAIDLVQEFDWEGMKQTAENHM